MRETVEQGGRHFGITEDGRPLTEGQIGRDDGRGAFIEPADQMEQELASSLGEGPIAELIKNDEVEAGEIIGEPPLSSGTRLGLEPVDEVDGGEEAATRAGTDARAGDGNREVGFACPGATDEHDIALLNDEAATCQIAHQGLVDRKREFLRTFWF
jgi:hypothetical protein